MKYNKYNTGFFLSFLILFFIIINIIIMFGVYSLPNNFQEKELSYEDVGPTSLFLKYNILFKPEIFIYWTIIGVKQQLNPALIVSNATVTVRVADDTLYLVVSIVGRFALVNTSGGVIDVVKETNKTYFINITKTYHLEQTEAGILLVNSKGVPVASTIYYIGPLPLSEKTYRLIFGWSKPSVPIGATLCIVPGNASKVEGLQELLTYRVARPGESVEIQVDKSFIIRIELPKKEAGSTAVSILQPCIDVSVLVIETIPLGGLSLESNVDKGQVLMARATYDVSGYIKLGKVIEILDNRLWTAAIPSGNDTGTLVLVANISQLTFREVSGDDIINASYNIMGFSAAGSVLLQDFQALYHSSGILLRASYSAPGSVIMLPTVKVALLPALDMDLPLEVPGTTHLGRPDIGSNAKQVTIEIMLSEHNILPSREPIVVAGTQSGREKPGTSVVLMALLAGIAVVVALLWGRTRAEGPGRRGG